MSSADESQYGLIILGNSGVGKSFLGNVLLGEDVFTHEFSPRSVTHRTEFKEITFENHRYAIFNIPGLIEADQARVNVNKCEIDHAFSKRPNSLIIYVFGQQNGRIRDEDVVAFTAINKAYPLNIKSLLLVVNGLPEDRPSNYEGEVMLMIQDIIQISVSPERVCFLNQIDRGNSKERQALKEQLLRAIVELTPTKHMKVQDIHLRVDEVAALKQQIEEMTKAFEQNKKFFQEEIRQHQKRYDEFVARQTDESDQFHRIIERQTVETKKMRESQNDQMKQMEQAHAEQLSRLEEELKDMQTEHERLENKLENKNKNEANEIKKQLQRSIEAQNELRAKLEELSNRKPEVIYQTESSSCFTAGTMIRMDDGTDKPIEKIQIGDIVVGANSERHTVIFVDIEQLHGRSLYGINNIPPFFTSEHVFLTTNGTMAAIDPQASEDEEPSLRDLVKPLRINMELQSLDQNRPSSVSINQLTCIKADPSLKVYNIVLDSGHTYHANEFCVFDMFPNLAHCPRMFKFLHLLWRQCATEIDASFDDIVTPGSTDRARFEELVQIVQQTISNYLAKH
ncbi:hypothetical protein I4U23_004841 [Adineta vaga]|nr:hypothetical protein I4U23_004841 [Adineta vaga]